VTIWAVGVATSVVISAGASDDASFFDEFVIEEQLERKMRPNNTNHNFLLTFLQVIINSFRSGSLNFKKLGSCHALRLNI
jgi:hypothetical protein